MFWTTKQFFMMKGLPIIEPPKQIRTKQVRFSDKSRIILIPDRTEYCTVKNDMWYSDYDYYKFKIAEYGRQVENHFSLLKNLPIHTSGVY
jgi:hypothetical protein